MRINVGFSFKLIGIPKWASEIQVLFDAIELSFSIHFRFNLQQQKSTSTKVRKPKLYIHRLIITIYRGISVYYYFWHLFQVLHFKEDAFPCEGVHPLPHSLWNNLNKRCQYTIPKRYRTIFSKLKQSQVFRSNKCISCLLN